MAVSITMPQLGESVTEGTVTRWLKDVGDVVAVDEPLLEVSTDKVDTEIPSPAAGVLLEIRAVEDEVVEVGAVLAIVGETSEATALSAPSAPAPEAVAGPSAEPAAQPVQASVAEPVTTPTVAGESTNVVLPALGESVTEGTVTRWLKSVGDHVDADEALLEVSTDKVDTEIPSPVSGTLTEIAVNEDETVDVGTVLGVVSASSGVTVEQTPSQPTAPVQQVVSAPTTDVATGDDESTPYASPIVRKLAKESGLDLASVRGSGPGGRIQKSDVLAASKSAPQASEPPALAATQSPPQMPVELTTRGRTEPLSRLRRLIAERMVESLQVSAQLTSVVEIDVSRVAVLRTRAKPEFLRREGVSLSFTPFFARAALEALRAYPTVNASIDIDAMTVTYHDREHLGMAVDTDRGLLVPVVRDAGDLTLAGLARRIADLAERTRLGQVSPDELSGGTFTVTNTGSRGALFDTPIINQPQVAILATGAVVKRPVVITGSDGEDAIAIRSMAYFALTYDHRIVDGADAARFLAAIKVRLEAADFEAELGL